MSSKKPHIIVDVERMKHPFTGLYYYCKNLAVNLEKYHSDKFNFHFFSYPKVKFPKYLNRINRSHLDKFHLVKPKKYKIWHSTWQDTKYVPKKGMKFIYTIHDLNFLYTDKPEHKKKNLLKKVQEKIDLADAITVISEFVRQDVSKNLDLKGKNVYVIHNGVDVNEYPYFDSPKYRPKNKFLFTVGTVLYKKHFHVLPRLLVGNDFELIIGGIHPEKSYVKQIEEEALKYGVSNRVHLIGPITDEEKYWYTTNAEAFLFPSISEGFGLPPIEAMRLGKPVFLSTLTSLPEVGGKHAYYFENFDAEHMQNVLKEGLDDYHLNQRKDEIIKWSKQFSWENSTKGYVEVYQKTLGLPINATPFIKKRKKVTAIIPTLNEEKNIKEAIASVAWADEIIIIDSYSTDRTVKIAEEFKVRVIQRKFDNFSNQKNYAIEQATHDWIFILDADERVPEDLRLEITSTLENTKEYIAYRIPRQNYISGNKIKYSGWQNDRVTRLFNRKYAKYNGRFVHEEISAQGKTGNFSEKLIHYTYDNYNHFITKLELYSELKGREMISKGKKYYPLMKYFAAAFRFAKHYILKLGFLDGKDGYMISYFSAISIIKRYDKLRELQKQQKA